MRKVNALVLFLVAVVAISALVMILALAKNKLRYGNDTPETSTKNTYKGLVTSSPTVTPTPTQKPTVESITSEIENIIVEPVDNEIKSLTKELEQL